VSHDDVRRWVRAWACVLSSVYCETHRWPRSGQTCRRNKEKQIWGPTATHLVLATSRSVAGRVHSSNVERLVDLQNGFHSCHFYDVVKEEGRDRPLVGRDLRMAFVVEAAGQPGVEVEEESAAHVTGMRKELRTWTGAYTEEEDGRGDGRRRADEEEGAGP